MNPMADQITQQILAVLYVSKAQEMKVPTSSERQLTLSADEAVRTFRVFEPLNPFDNLQPEGPPRPSAMHPGWVEMAIRLPEPAPLEWQLHLLSRRDGGRKSHIYFAGDRLIVIMPYHDRSAAIDELSQDCIATAVERIAEQVSTELRLRLDLALGPENYSIEARPNGRFDLRVASECLPVAQIVVSQFGPWLKVRLNQAISPRNDSLQSAYTTARLELPGMAELPPPSLDEVVASLQLVGELGRWRVTLELRGETAHFLLRNRESYDDPLTELMEQLGGWLGARKHHEDATDLLVRQQGEGAHVRSPFAGESGKSAAKRLKEFLGEPLYHQLLRKHCWWYG
jgi:hypothetical protein